MRPATISRSSGSDGTTSITGSLRDRAETASADLKRYIKGSIGFNQKIAECSKLQAYLHDRRKHEATVPNCG